MKKHFYQVLAAVSFGLTFGVEDEMAGAILLILTFLFLHLGGVVNFKEEINKPY